MQRSARSTSYICSSRIRFSASCLEGSGGGGKVGVLVAEQLVGDLAGEQHPDVGVSRGWPCSTRYMPMLARMVVMS